MTKLFIPIYLTSSLLIPIFSLVFIGCIPLVLLFYYIFICCLYDGTLIAFNYIFINFMINYYTILINNRYKIIITMSSCILFGYVVRSVFGYEALLPSFNYIFILCSVGFVLVINIMSCFFSERNFFSMENILHFFITLLVFILIRTFSFSIVYPFFGNYVVHFDTTSEKLWNDINTNPSTTVHGQNITRDTFLGIVNKINNSGFVWRRWGKAETSIYIRPDQIPMIDLSLIDYSNLDYSTLLQYQTALESQRNGFNWHSSLCKRGIETFGSAWDEDIIGDIHTSTICKLPFICRTLLQDCFVNNNIPISYLMDYVPKDTRVVEYRDNFIQMKSIYDDYYSSPILSRVIENNNHFLEGLKPGKAKYDYYRTKGFLSLEHERPKLSLRGL